MCGLTWIESAHRDQDEPEVAHFGQHPVQGGLIGKRSRDDRLAAFAPDLEAVEPGRPAAVENPVHADLVT